MNYIKCIEKSLGVKAKLNFLPLQKGDVISTKASLKKIKKNIGYIPKTSIQIGIKNFVQWYQSYYKE
jgi:UDP-glucuronate 4-epimerase